MPYFLNPRTYSISKNPSLGSEVPVSSLLAAFIDAPEQQGQAREGEWKLEDGVYNLHPGIRWYPGDRVPKLTKSDNNLFPAGIEALPLVNLNEASFVNATERLAAFVAEQAQATSAEWIQLEDGTYDLHPDARFPADAQADAACAADGTDWYYTDRE